MLRASAPVLVLFLLGSALLAAPPSDSTRIRKVTFPFKSTAQLGELESSGAFEIVSVKHGRVIALERVNADGESLVPFPRPSGFSVLMENLDDELAAFRAQGSEGAYHSVAENEAELRQYAQAQPALCHLESIGKSFEGRDLWALRITGAADPTKVPRLLIFGLVHAREWITAELPHHIIRKLVDGYGTDPAIKQLVDTRCVWVVPVANPDGLEYAQTQYTMWRKNRSRRASSIGVDINRNFEVGWGLGSSASPGADTYRGPSANSEEETKALLALAGREKPHASLSFHSYSELVLYPWGYTRTDPPAKDVLERHGQAMAKANGYEAGCVAQILYIAGGGSDDTLFSKYGAWPWTFELGTSFVPPESQIQSLCAKNWPAVLHLLRSMDELAATPPPFSPSASVTRRLAALEEVLGRESGLLVDPTGIDGGALGELLVTIADQARTDRGLADEILRRAGQPARRSIYSWLARSVRARNW